MSIDSHEKYPFQNDWPIEGFAMEKSEFVQFRIVSVLRAKPPFKGYSPKESVPKQYKTFEWWEVRICFRPYSQGKGLPRSGKYLEIRNHQGRLLQEKGVSQCIARFETESEACAFMNKLHQSKYTKNFFVNFSDMPNNNGLAHQ